MGKYYAITYPLRDGIDDECYESIFRPLITRIMEQVAISFEARRVYPHPAAD